MTLYTHVNADAVPREWARLKLTVMRDESLRSLSYWELYERLFDHYSEKSNSTQFYNVLLLTAIVCCFAVDTSICERGFSLMNLLKTAKRSRMGTKLLRMLMTICTLGEEWKDPSKIPAAEIVDIWREESKGGRYLNKFIWGMEALVKEKD